MKALVAVVGALVLASGPPRAAAAAGPGQPARAADARSAMSAAIAWGKGLWGSPPRFPVCPSIDWKTAPLDSLRQARARPSPDHAPFGAVEYWRGLAQGPAGGLDERLKARLGAALEAAAARPAAPLLDPGGDLRWFPFTPDWPGCRELSVSAPELEGDFAFVAVAHLCPGTCSDGWLLALERRDGRWVAVASVTTFVS